MVEEKPKPKFQVKFHQVFYVCALLVIFFFQLEKAHSQGFGVAYALGGTTFFAIVLGFLIFGWVWLNAKIFQKPKDNDK